MSTSTQDIQSLVVQPPFSAIFPILEGTKRAIIQDMIKNGFDESCPIVVWEESNIVVDGNTRYQAAKEVGLKLVPVSKKSFESEEEALDYAIRCQRDRRNLTDSALVMCCEHIDQLRVAGRPQKLAQSCANKDASKKDTNSKSGKSSEITAKMLNISPRKVEQIRTVLKHGDEEIVERVKTDTETLNSAYRAVQKKRKESQESQEGKSSKPVFNRQTNDTIEYAQYTWNIVVGCKFGCKYCFARSIVETRLKGNFDELQVYLSRLAATKNTSLPKSTNLGARRVLVNTMGDLFGDWVDDEVIQKVVEAAREAPEWTFLFLTKNPSRMIDIKWPENAWVGATVDTQARVEGTEEAFSNIQAGVKFVSCEPLLEKLTFDRLNIFDWIVLGGQTAANGEPAKQPDWLWAEDLVAQARKASCKIYFKPNLKVRPNEFPEPAKGKKAGRG